MKKRISSLSIPGCVLLLIAGCATIVGKSVYPVAITSRPAEADITVVDETGKTVFKGKTPTTVSLSTKAGYFQGKDYTVTFAKPGYANQTAQIKRGVSGWYIGGNFLFGGLIGWLIVDPLTGAMWTLQEETSATLSPQTSMQKSDASVQVVSIDEVPDSLRSKMIRVQ
jgi:hypothetical protein